MKVLTQKTEDIAKRKFKTEEELQKWSIKFKNARRIRKAQKWSEDNKCYYCRTKLRFDKATYDHIIPQSKFGSEHPNNFAIACEPCNNIRGDMDFNIFSNIVTSVEDRNSYNDFLKSFNKSNVIRNEETQFQKIDRLFHLIKEKREKAIKNNNIKKIKFCNSWRRFLNKVHESRIKK